MTLNSNNWGIRTQLAAQMYTVREHTKSAADLTESLTKIAAIGYPGVQMSAIGAMNGESPEVSARQARKLLDDNNLKCVATHRGWNDLVSRTEYEIEFHQTLGCDYTAVGSIPGEYRQDGLAGFSRWASEAIELASKLKAAGIRFGYHNHEFEFERSGADRKSFYDILISEGSPDLFLELDVYWAQHAGVDPTGLIQKLCGRLPVVHVKDKEVVAGKSVMAPIGEGNLDWSRIIPALKSAGTEWFCVEQDDYLRDPFDCLRSSFQYLSAG